MRARKFFSARISFLCVVYFLLVVLNKSASILKNLGIIKYGKDKNCKKLLFLALAGVVSSLKELVIFPVEIKYLSKCAMCMHRRIEAEVWKGGAESDVSALLAERDACSSIAEERARYLKKYTEQFVRICAILVSLSQTNCTVLAATSVFCLLDLYLKRRIQKLEEHTEKTLAKYCALQEHACSTVAGLNEKSKEIEDLQTEKYKEERRHAHKGYRLCESKLVRLYLSASALTVLGTAIFHAYTALCIVFLYEDKKALALFIVIHKKIEKLSKYFKKII
ncbi:uncharacterized protein NEMAJ01_0938 [Nematocida major]|uniref:uncharacterized protein n=1 Tax=Nematocida major TaxID=1912982 RepID=UPI0020074B44|nr:uncharacterized protein NEMAJ01_0938 [Nematocida major]KAH9386042.1 hypothetical protein NEMAJ01_0938 [Nematocida major]